jgi:predicted nucleic acid-binding protein
VIWVSFVEASESQKTLITINQSLNILKKNMVYKKVFLDTDVIIDYLCQREEFLDSASLIFNLLQNKKIQGYISVVVFCNLYYNISKLSSKAFARESLSEIIKHLKVLDVPGSFATKVLTSDFNDLEDAIQHETALNNKLDCIVTRNIKDFKHSKIKVLSPRDFLLEFFS